MRGMKASYYDGGHRVPFFIRWPNGNLQGRRDPGEMTLHIDLLPTFIDLCELEAPDAVSFDGISIADYLTGRVEALPERTQFLQYRQSTTPPEKWTNAVITKRWRLIYGKELYDIKADPEQQNDVAEQYPEVVVQLREQHEEWWAEVSPRLNEYCPIGIGNDNENPIRLDAFDVMGDVAWNQAHISLAMKNTGCWRIDVEEPGDYTFSLRRWPEELDLPIDGPVSSEDANDHICSTKDGKFTTIEPIQARLSIFDQEWTVEIDPGIHAVTFNVNLTQTGVTLLNAWFLDEASEETGAYYVYIERT